jgi:hypothetical protein
MQSRERKAGRTLKKRVTEGSSDHDGQLPILLVWAWGATSSAFRLNLLPPRLSLRHNQQRFPPEPFTSSSEPEAQPAALSAWTFYLLVRHNQQHFPPEPFTSSWGTTSSAFRLNLLPPRLSLRHNQQRNLLHGLDSAAASATASELVSGVLCGFGSSALTNHARRAHLQASTALWQSTAKDPHPRLIAVAFGWFDRTKHLPGACLWWWVLRPHVNRVQFQRPNRIIRYQGCNNPQIKLLIRNTTQGLRVMHKK